MLKLLFLFQLLHICSFQTISVENTHDLEKITWTYKPYLHCDYFGYDFKNSTMPNVLMCQKDCHYTTFCTHYTYNMITKTCYLKSNNAKYFSPAWYYTAYCGFSLLAKNPILYTDVSNIQYKINIETLDKSSFQMCTDKYFAIDKCTELQWITVSITNQSISKCWCKNRNSKYLLYTFY